MNYDDKKKALYKKAKYPYYIELVCCFLIAILGAITSIADDMGLGFSLFFGAYTVILICLLYNHAIGSENIFEENIPNFILFLLGLATCILKFPQTFGALVFERFALQYSHYTIWHTIMNYAHFVLGTCFLVESYFVHQMKNLRKKENLVA